MPPIPGGTGHAPPGSAAPGTGAPVGTAVTTAGSAAGSAVGSVAGSAAGSAAAPGSGTPAPAGPAAGAASAAATGAGAAVPAVPLKRDVYRALVRNPDDLLAALAYVAYKHHEIEFIQAVEASGGTVTPEKLEAFQAGCCVDSQLDKYTARAEKLVNAFLSETLDKRKTALEIEFAQTATGTKLNAILGKFEERRTFQGWLADAGNNLAVQAATILLVAGLYFGYQALDSAVSWGNKHLGVSASDTAQPATAPNPAGPTASPPPGPKAGQAADR